jgi:hypothetical protein
MAKSTAHGVSANPYDRVPKWILPPVMSFSLPFIVMVLQNICAAFEYPMYIHMMCKKSSSTGKTGLGKKDAKKSGKKDSQLVLRLDKVERDAFVELCKEMDTSAAREIRGFIRRFMKENGED